MRIIQELKSLMTSEKLNYGIISIPLQNIKIDTTLFQNREEEYSVVSVNAIVSETLQNGKLNTNKFVPITVWKNNNEYFILAGHSRFEAFKRLSIHFQWAKSIPSKIFEGNRTEAIEFARNSNSFADPEKITARAKLYREYRINNNWSEKQLAQYIKENEKNYNHKSVLNLSYLNPKGLTIENYKSFLNASDSTQENIRDLKEKTEKPAPSQQEKYTPTIQNLIKELKTLK
jgi:hypothetical protein